MESALLGALYLVRWRRVIAPDQTPVEPRKAPVRIGEEGDLPDGVEILLGALYLVRWRRVIAPFQTPVESRGAPPEIGGEGVPPDEVAHTDHQGGTGLEAGGGDPHHEISADDWIPERDWSLDDLGAEEIDEVKVRIEGTCHLMI